MFGHFWNFCSCKADVYRAIYDIGSSILNIYVLLFFCQQNNLTTRKDQAFFWSDLIWKTCGFECLMVENDNRKDLEFEIGKHMSWRAHEFRRCIWICYGVKHYNIMHFSIRLSQQIIVDSTHTWHKFYLAFFCNHFLCNYWKALSKLYESKSCTCYCLTRVYLSK